MTVKEKPAQRRRQMRIFREIQGERNRQDRKWGGELHDDGHTTKEFAGLMSLRTRYLEMWGDGPDGREKLIALAALAFASIERIDRAEERKAANLKAAERMARRKR